MKKMILFACALITAAAGMVLGAGAAETSAEDILAKYAEESANVKQALADTNFNADIKLSIPDAGMDLAITADGSMPMGFTLDPIQLGMEGNFNVSAMGQELGMTMKMYMVPEDDTLAVYSFFQSSDEEGGQWEYATMAPEEFEEFKKALTDKMVSFDFSALPISFELEGTTDVNGASCYVLKAALTWEDLLALINYASEVSGQDLGDTSELSEVGAYMEGLVMNLELDINTETYYAQRMHIDMDGSNWAVLEQILPMLMDMSKEDGSYYSVSLAVNSLYVDVVYDYETEVSIEVPADAAAAKAAGGDELSVDDAEGALDQILNGIGG